MESCALLVACNTACGSCLNAPVLVPALRVAPSYPACASQIKGTFSTKLWSPLTYPSGDYHFQLLSLTLPDVVRLRIGFMDHMIFAYG